MAKKKNTKKFSSFEISELSNACQTLLANIRFASVDDDVHTIVVTSTVPDEGKTTVSTNLALAIASSGKRVLLVEADMRRRCLASLLGVHPANGMHAVLSGRVAPEDAVVATSYQNLYFLDSEPNIPSPPDILSSKRFVTMLDTLDEMFDYVIFDAPPVGVFIDAAIIGSVVDGALLIVRERKTKRDEAANAVQQLRAANTRILGVVMTFTNQDETNYYAYYNQQGKRVDKSKGEGTGSFRKGASLPPASGASQATTDASVSRGRRAATVSTPAQRSVNRTSTPRVSSKNPYKGVSTSQKRN